MFKSIVICFLTLLFSLSGPMPLHAIELNTWPREVKVSSGSITIYQPQVESLQENILKGKAAIAYHAQGKDAPLFGVVWFSSRVTIDRQQNSVRYETLSITDTRFPEENKLVADEFRHAVEQGMKTRNMSSSLDELTTALTAVEQEQKQAANLKTTPPAIIYMDHPALLVTIDSKAVLKKDEKSSYQAVVNTPYPLFFASESSSWHLNVADNVWYRAKDVDGPWAIDGQAPSTLRLMVAEEKAIQNVSRQQESTTSISAENAPAIVVVHQPTELVVSTGKATFAPITDNLLAMSNTNSQVFMDVGSQQYFLVVAGRWYRAKSMQGNWEYVSSSSLPATFADIPKDSKHADVRSYVAGTDEAREAVMDAQIPQTAAVKRGSVDIQVSYDGAPKFKEIGGTGLQFALNCSETVIAAGNSYYLVKDAVWYISNSANGPWTVSDHAPPKIDRVPPSSPVYNTKYVYVYDSTPDVVYVGYTPGYVGSYIYGPTIVYGTGYYYRPWITPHYYYPRPATWGFNVSYNSWSGWGFGLSWSSGPFHFGFYTGGGYHGSHWGGHHYWGPRGYRPSFHQVNINTVNINHNRFNNFSYHNNLYRHGGQRATIHNTVNFNTINRSNRVKIKNNVMVDRSGNVLRHQNGQWQQHRQGQWSNRNISTSTISSRTAVRSHSGYNRATTIDRQHYSRQRAVERSSQFHGRTHYRSGGRRHR